MFLPSAIHARRSCTSCSPTCAKLRAEEEAMLPRRGGARSDRVRTQGLMVLRQPRLLTIGAEWNHTTRTVKMSSCQSVDGIYIARARGIGQQFTYTHAHAVVVSPAPPNQCWRGQYLFHSAGVPMWPHFNTDSGVEGGQTSRTSCCGDLENLTFFRAIFLPSTVPIRLSNGGTEWDKDMHDVSFWRHAHATTMMLPSLQFICHSCRASLSWNIDKGEI